MQMAIGLTFPGSLQDESVICKLCKNFNIDLKIIEASFSVSRGWAMLEIEGDEEELGRSFDYLISRGVKIQQIGKENDEPEDEDVE